MGSNCSRKQNTFDNKNQSKNQTNKAVEYPKGKYFYNFSQNK